MMSIDFTATITDVFVIFIVGERCMTNDQVLEGTCSLLSKCEAAVM